MTEGRLVQTAIERRWAIDDPHEGSLLTSGRTIELWLGGQWIEGHIEYYGPSGGQHFDSHGGGYCALTIGMRVRTV
jgi:Domain of unknown function (DUF5348)